MNRSFFTYFVQLFAVLMLASCSDNDGPDNFEPQLFVDGAVDITRTEATVAGHADLRGNQTKPKFTFEYGADERAMNIVVSAESDNDGAMTARLAGLSAGTQYYFRLKSGYFRHIFPVYPDFALCAAHYTLCNKFIHKSPTPFLNIKRQFDIFHSINDFNFAF